MLKKHFFALICIVLLTSSSMLVSIAADACTRVVYLGANNQVITARSMDWKTDVGTNL